MERKKYIFETRLDIRDYEYSAQGIVDNTNYLHYTEHTHHRFLESLGVSLSELHEKGVDVVITRIQLAYKVPFARDDKIISRMSLKKNGLRWVFSHSLFRAGDGRLCFHADVDLVTLINGRLGSNEGYDGAFARIL